MMINTQYINLNMVPSGVLPILYMSQHDIGRPLGMVVYNGGETVDLDSYACTIEATRTDGTAITTAVTTDDNIGVFVTTATMTNQADKYLAKLVLFDSNSRRVASLAFVMCVTPKTMDENAEGIEEDRSLYQQYTGTVQTLIAEIREDLQAETERAETAEAGLRTDLDHMYEWYNLRYLTRFGRIAYYDIDAFGTGAYIEDITYDTKRNLYYIGTSAGAVYAINPNTMSISASYQVMSGAFASIDYCPTNDRIYAMIANAVYAINPNTMTIEGSALSITGRLLYDTIRHIFVAFTSTSAGIITVTEYTYESGTFIEGDIFTVDYGIGTVISQGGCVHDGRIYTANLSAILEIDYRNNRCNKLYLNQNLPHKVEVEGFCVEDGKIVSACNIYGVGDAYIFRYGYKSMYNMQTIQTNENTYYTFASLTGGDAIVSGDDLDSYTRIGNYYARTNAIAGTLSNCPTTLAFTLKVIRSAGTGPGRVQILRTIGPVVTEYKRYYIESSWGAWIKTSAGEILGNYPFDLTLAGSQDTSDTPITTKGIFLVSSRRAGLTNLSPRANALYLVFFSGNSLDTIVKLYGEDNAAVEVVFDGTSGFYLRNTMTVGYHVSVIRIG